jgi:hypothetical protein
MHLDFFIILAAMWNDSSIKNPHSIDGMTLTLLLRPQHLCHNIEKIEMVKTFQTVVQSGHKKRPSKEVQTAVQQEKALNVGSIILS